MAKRESRNPFRTVWRYLVELVRGANQAQREKAVALTQYEARELENMFVLMLLGSFAGMPSPPSSLSVELLPYLEHEIKVLNHRAENSTDALAEIMGQIDADA